VSGLTTALENVQPTDIAISDITGLETALGIKQSKITANSYLSIIHI
jgi:hypothetical protein